MRLAFNQRGSWVGVPENRPAGYDLVEGPGGFTNRARRQLAAVHSSGPGQLCGGLFDSAPFGRHKLMLRGLARSGRVSRYEPYEIIHVNQRYFVGNGDAEAPLQLQDDVDNVDRIEA